MGSKYFFWCGFTVAKDLCGYSLTSGVYFNVNYDLELSVQNTKTNSKVIPKHTGW